MEVYVSLGIIILGGLIVASLQLSIGTLLLLYHASFGKKIQTKTKELTSSFIAGSTFMSFMLLGTTLFLVSVLSTGGVLPRVAYIFIFGVLIALSIAVCLFYYRRKGSTELWLPRQLASYIRSRAIVTNDNSEAFSLGILVLLSEILFTLPLLVISADAILHLKTIYQALGLVIFTSFSALPLLILRFFIRRGRNIAEVQRWRIRNKTFFRFFTSVSFAVLAMFILAFIISKGDA